MSSNTPIAIPFTFTPADNSVVRLVRELEWLTVNPIPDGNKNLTIKLSGVERTVVLSREACAHLAALLTTSGANAKKRVPSA